MIFTNISEFKKFAGGTIHFDMELDSMAPAYHLVVQNHIIPLLGQALWNEITQNWESPSGELSNLLPYLRRPLSLLTVWNHARYGTVNFSDAGMTRTETDNAKTAFKYQENSHRSFTREAGFAALEELQLFLNGNANDYASYKDSNEHKASLSMLINTARTFQTYYGQSVNRYVFESLRSVIKNIELFIIEPAIGTAQYQELLDGIFADNLGDPKLDLLIQLQRAIAHFAIEEGLYKNYITVEGDRISKKEVLEPQGLNKSSTPSLTEIHLSKRYHQFEASKLLARVLDFLQVNLDDYPLYQSYYEANLEVEQNAEEARQEELLLNPGKEDGGLIRF